MYRQDFIKRQIELFAQVLARLAGFRTSGSLQEASREVREAYRALGVDPALLELDALTLVRLLRDPDKIQALCALLEEHAKLHDALDRRGEGDLLRAQAHALQALVATR